MGQTSCVILIMDSLALIKLYPFSQYLIIEGFQLIKGSVFHQVFKSLHLHVGSLASLNSTRPDLKGFVVNCVHSDKTNFVFIDFVKNFQCPFLNT